MFRGRPLPVVTDLSGGFPVPGVLTPLDGSRFGEFALPYAADIADRTRSSLHLVHAHVPDPRNRRPEPATLPVSSPAPWEQRLRARQGYLTDAVRRFGLEVGSATALLAEEGVPTTIRRHAEALGSDLIVMSTHGRTGLDRLWLGSVADTVARSTRIPVLLVRPRWARRSSGGLSGIKRVLVPLDTDGVGEEILDPVMRLGEPLGWRFVLLHVVSTRLLLGARPYPIHVQNLDRERRRGREYLHAVASEFHSRGLSAEVRVVEATAPDRAILRLSRSGEVDMVAMASHGRGGLTRAVLGSVADRVLAGTALPVLLGGGRGPAVH